YLHAVVVHSSPSIFSPRFFLHPFSPSSILLLVFIRLLRYSYPLFAGIASAPSTPATLAYGRNPRSLSMGPCGRRKDISRLQSFGCVHGQGLFITFSPCLLFCLICLVC